MNIFLKTERLIIKPSTPEDFDDLYAIQSDPDVMQYVGEGARNIKEVKQSLENIIAHHQKHGFSFGSVFEKTSKLLIGQAGLCYLGNDDSQPEIEVGYRLKKQHWGNGYATELTKALITWGFNNLTVDKLVAVARLENKRSCRVLEKAGMDYVGNTNYLGEEVLKFEIYKNDQITLVPYDPKWSDIAKIEIKKLYEILPNNHIIDIQHIGSTAIPDILSKPIIDIQIAVDSLSAIKQIAIDKLKTLDYVYWDDNPDKQRMFFVKGMPPYGDKRTHHVHIVEPSSRHWQGKINFRDYLLTHSESAREYEQLKIKLAQQYTYDREQYTAAKTEFVNDVLNKASLDIKNSKNS